MSKTTAVYLEVGKKRVFAGAIDWPGWCRSAGDEQGALQALLEYGPRYAKVLHVAGIEFKAPAKLSELKVVERVKGNTTTDFGAPGMAPSADGKIVRASDLRRLEEILEACWSRFDAATRKAQGKQLRTGPRGGGRDLKRMFEHVIGGAEAYFSALGWKFKVNADEPVAKRLKGIREAIPAGLAASVRGEIPKVGPRGGRRWTARYFVRRSAWHVLDHAWEIEDRLG